MPTVSTIAGIIRKHGAERPGAPALIYRDRTYTYGEIDERSNRLANALAAEGIGEQERVARLDKNSPEWADLAFATAKLNAVTCDVNWRLAPSEAAFIVNDAEAKVLIVGEEFLPVLEAMEPDLTTVKKVVVVGGSQQRYEDYEAWLARHAATDPGFDSGADDVAMQFYSSGTTGRPKGVMLTNNNLFASTDSVGAVLGFGEESVSLVAMPMFHVAGGLWAFIGLYFGTVNVVMREVDPAGIIDLIPRHGVTHSVFVPAVLQFLLMTPGVQEADFSSLVAILYGASPITEAVLKDSLRTFGCRFIQAYGLTETTGAIVLLPHEDHDPAGPNAHRLRAAGVAGPGVELRVVDAAGADVPLGDIGEIVTRSKQNMKGYWKMPEATAESFLADGWFRSGDAGYLDADGYLYIHDRVKDMVVSGGENIYPAEVENALMAHPAIADVGVIGVPDDRWGEAVKACVVKAPDAEVTEQEIIEFVRGRLAHFKCPRSIDFVPELPRNPSGKILKKDLRAPYWVGRTRNVN
jgi:long-chain acyl-CoA synthetase